MARVHPSHTTTTKTETTECMVVVQLATTSEAGETQCGTRWARCKMLDIMVAEEWEEIR